MTTHNTETNRNGVIDRTPAAEQASLGAALMKTYVGERRGSHPCVFVCQGLLRRPLRHRVPYNRTGFEWGYSGSGPLELARCILIDHFGEEIFCKHCDGGLIQAKMGRDPCPQCYGQIYKPPVSCRDFRNQMIATLPSGAFDTWEITQSEIEEWLRSAPKLA